MKKTTNCVALAALLMFATSTAHAVVSFDFDPVGNVGNPDDSTGFGGVDRFYEIATTEVTNAQYAEFLNAIGDSDPNGVWSGSMDITRAGTDGSYIYTVNSGFGSKPVDPVSFFNAMRFVNWMQNDQPTGPQDATTTEDGTYLISDGTSETRAEGATFFLPSEDEWYKAAYYDPVNAGADALGTPDYWLYPTQSDTAPTAEEPAGGTNSANFDSVALPGMTTTNVGSYRGTNSFYGGSDFGGNVFEWTEGVSGSDRVIRGGTWSGSEELLRSTSRTLVLPSGGSASAGFGFRIAAYFTPEPGSAVLAVIGTVLLMLFSGRRFQKRTR